MMLLLLLTTFGFGCIVSGGVLTVLLSVGLVPRFAEETNTAASILTYENAIILGTVMGCLWTVFPQWFSPGSDAVAGNTAMLTMRSFGNLLRQGSLVFYGFFSGIFEGCVAMAIAEMLDSIPIFTRRIGFKKGLSFMVCSIGLGKAVGSFLYFFYGLWATI